MARPPASSPSISPDLLVLETSRLRLRRFTGADMPVFLAYRNDPEIARYQSWESYSEVEGQAFLEHQRQTLPGTPGAWCQFALEELSSGRMLGDCALHVDGTEQRKGEIGFTLARENQGRGFATEAVGRLLEYAFDELGLHRVVAITDCRNHASVSLLERVGMRREAHFHEHIWFKGGWGDEYLYARLQREWRERRG